MHSQLTAILLATVAIGSCIASPALISGHSRMFELMSATSEQQRNNPQLAAACFNYYNPILNSDLAAYDEEYAQCSISYDEGRLAVLKRYDDPLWDVSNYTFDACKRVLDCDFLENSQVSLNCYANKGPIESKELNTAAFNASKLYSSLGQEVEQLQFSRELCFNISRRNYELRSGNTYQDLQSCLMGLSPVPEITTTTTTTTTEPTTTTTVLISSSTDEVTTTTTPLPNDSSSTISPSTISHFGSNEGNSAHSEHQRTFSNNMRIFT